MTSAAGFRAAMLGSFAVFALVMVVLIALGVVAFWLGAVILVSDLALNLFFIRMRGRAEQSSAGSDEPPSI